MSKTRKVYFVRLFCRCGILAAVILLYIWDKSLFNVIKGMNFFRQLSPLHFLWIIWAWDMILQLIPIKAHISIGSRKNFFSVFKPIKEKINYAGLKKYVKDTTKSAYKVFVLWCLLIGIIGVLKIFKVIDSAEIVLVSVFFYVCDLICVLIWCPFRLIMGNKCCTTCRIFNWDHIMMFSPFAFVKGFYGISLFCMSAVIWLIWEICVYMHPERFWENSNMALQCSECTDKLCTQYCRRLR